MTDPDLIFDLDALFPTPPLVDLAPVERQRARKSRSKDRVKAGPKGTNRDDVDVAELDNRK